MLVSSHAADVFKSERLHNSRQLIVVRVTNPATPKGTLQCYERASLTATWRPVGKPVPIVVGKYGISAQKQEGDGKSPAGIYSIGQAFGFAPQKDQQIKLDYMVIKPTTICVDDPKSKYYNQIVDTDKIAQRDWSSGEKMHDYPIHYQRGIVVNYNTQQPKPGAGSCIFLHIKPTTSHYTAGCVAMAPAQIDTLLHWLDPNKQPFVLLR